MYLSCTILLNQSLYFYADIAIMYKCLAQLVDQVSAKGATGVPWQKKLTRQQARSQLHPTILIPRNKNNGDEPPLTSSVLVVPQTERSNARSNLSNLNTHEELGTTCPKIKSSTCITQPRATLVNASSSKRRLAVPEH